MFKHHRFEAHHDGGGLLGVRSGTDRQTDVRLGHLELIEKDLRHLGVIMLAGVDEGLPDIGSGAQCFQHRCRFHKIGARTHHVDNIHSHLPTVRIELDLGCDIKRQCRYQCRFLRQHAWGRSPHVSIQQLS